jgi:hypothetical protein
VRRRRCVEPSFRQPDSSFFWLCLWLHPNTIYVATFQKGVLRSRDGGATLTPIDGPFEGSRRVSELLVTARNQPGILYAAALDGGLFFGRFE